MSLLQVYNFLFLQWFCVRLVCMHGENGDVLGYTLLKWCMPLTGWWTPYIWIGRNPLNS